MGGARRYPYPKWVWTPFGGWWGSPKVTKPRDMALFVAFNTVFDRRDSSVTWAPSHSRSIAARIEKERADRKVALAELEDDEDI